MTAKGVPAKHQAWCVECGAGIESVSKWSVTRWTVIHIINHQECPHSSTREDES